MPLRLELKGFENQSLNPGRRHRPSPHTAYRDWTAPCRMWKLINSSHKFVGHLRLFGTLGGGTNFFMGLLGFKRDGFWKAL